MRPSAVADSTTPSTPWIVLRVSCRPVTADPALTSTDTLPPRTLASITTWLTAPCSDRPLRVLAVICVPCVPCTDTWPSTRVSDSVKSAAPWTVSAPLMFSRCSVTPAAPACTVRLPTISAPGAPRIVTPASPAATTTLPVITPWTTTASPAPRSCASSSACKAPSPLTVKLRTTAWLMPRAWISG